jgi:DNA-binding CsgD family transcriptional regulator
MLIDDRVSRLIGDIYAAAIAPEAWRAVLREIAGLTKARMTSLLAYQPPPGKDEVLEAFGLDPSFIESYQGYYYQRNIYAQGLRPLLREGLVATHEMYCSDASILRSEYYNDFQRRLGLFRVVAGVVESSPKRHLILSVNRGRHDQPFNKEELNLIVALLPHIRGALRIERNIRQDKPVAHLMIPPEQLASQFGLTKAEASFANLFATGLSITEVCQRLNIRMSTARTHLRHIYQKTGATRQADLLLRLLEFRGRLVSAGSNNRP